MALSDPYPLSAFSDILPVSDVRMDVQRNEEHWGTGDGRTSSSSLAPPLWVFDISLSTTRLALARQIDAMAFALEPRRGVSFLFADPSYLGPAAGDPGAGVVLQTIGEFRDQVRLGGLPAGFAVTPGDRFSVTWSGGVYLGVFAEPAIASGVGVIPLAAVFPYLPLGMSSGGAVEMRAPIARVKLAQDGYSPFQARLGFFGDSAQMRVIEKK